MHDNLQFRAALVKSARLISQEINQLLEPLELNYSLWQVIFLIQKQHVCSAFELAHELGVSKPSISKRIQILMDKSLIEQVSSPDRRQKLLQLTPLGHQTYMTCLAKIDAREALLFKDIPVEHKMVVQQVLTQLIQQLWQPAKEDHDVS